MRDLVDRLFTVGTSELFSVALAGKSSVPRLVQRDYALAVQAVIDGDGPGVSVGLLQAETGIGKSLGYLVPALLDAQANGRRVVVSTHTVALQNQIVTGVLPGVVEMVYRMTGKDIVSALRVGRRNFISVPAFRRFADLHRADTSSSPESVELLDLMQAMLEDDPASATIQLVQESLARDIEEAGGLPFALDKCAIGQEPGDTAGYDAMVALADAADVVVVNHALLALDIMTGGRILNDEAGRETIYIVDEADTLPDVIQSLLSRKLPMSELAGLANDAKALGLSKSTKFKRDVEILNDLLTQASSMNSLKVEGSSDKAEIMPVNNAVDRVWRESLVSALQNLKSGVQSFLKSGMISGSFRADLETVSYDIDAFLSSLVSVNEGDIPLSMPAVYWTPARKSPGLLISGGTPGMIVSNMWRKDTMRARALVLTSATLTGGGRGDDDSMLDFAIGIGMSKTVLETAFKGSFAPTGFGYMDFVVVDQATAPRITLLDEDVGEDEDVVAVTNPLAIDWWVAMIRTAAGQDDGRILVLPLSYRDARAIHAALGDVPGFSVVLDDRTARPIEAFKRDGRSILIAPGRWEGLDLPGMIRHIVIPRIPFSPPDVIQNALFEAFLRETKGVSAERLRTLRFPAMLAKARRKIKQGLGRGIRKVDDRVTVWIGDGRWPVPRELVLSGTRVGQPKWAGGMSKSVPERFRKELDAAHGFTPERGRYAVRAKNRHMA